MKLRLLSCCLALSTLFGCGADGRGDEFSAAVRDSAGVRITLNRGLDALGPLGREVADAPALTIGGEGGGPPLYQVTGATRLSDGRIVAASAGTKELRIYGADRKLLTRAGGAGEGPGEFQSLSWVGVLPGDSIAAWDVGLRRLSVFTPAGRFARAVTVEGPIGLFPRVVGVLGGGRMVLATGGGTGTGDLSGRVVKRDTVSYLVVSATGEVSDTIGSFPGSEQVMLGSPREGFLVRPLPFGKTTVAAVRGNRVYVATGDRYEIAAYEPGHGLKALVRADREPPPVTEEDIADYRRNLVTLGGEGDARANRQQERLLAAVPYPETMPALTGIEMDPQGNLWVRDPQKPGETSGALWRVFAPDGRARGTVRLPHGLVVHEIGSDWVLGIHLDEDAVEHLQLYRLTPTGAEAKTR